MPELIEVEYYREALQPLLGHRVTAVDIPDADFTRPRETPVELFEQLVGERLARTSRRGKLLCLHFDGPKALSVGLRFGMTGRLLIDGRGPIDRLEYSSGRNEPRWDRFVLTIDGRQVSIRDQRRLGSVELDPDIDLLGAEASTLTPSELAAAISGRSKAVKAVLLDQSLIAGLGNLLVDETLWRAGLAPTLSVAELGPQQIELLAKQICTTIAELSERGGSHTGDSFEARTAGATCPSDGGLMQHDTVGGRSTWWCPTHQGSGGTI